VKGTLVEITGLHVSQPGGQTSFLSNPNAAWQQGECP
jgi:hypothetical protein